MGRVIGLSHDYGREMSHQKGYSQVKASRVGQAERAQDQKTERVPRTKTISETRYAIPQAFTH